MESDLFTPRFRYGIDEWTHGFRKQRARMSELTQRMNAAAAEARAKQQEEAFLAGAIDDLKYSHATWFTKDASLGPKGAPKYTP